MTARARLWSLFGGLALTSVVVPAGAASLLARFALPGPLGWAPEHSLDAIAARFGILLAGRHQALGDAIGTGQLFLRLLELLEAEGVRTLGAALELAGRAVALRRRQAEAFGPRRGRRLVAGG